MSTEEYKTGFLLLMKGEARRGLGSIQPPPIPLLHKEGEFDQYSRWLIYES